MRPCPYNLKVKMMQGGELPFQAVLDKLRAEPMGKPNATVYVQNLNERVKISDVKNQLF